MAKKTLRDVELKGKRVVMRVDFNVPMAKDGSGKITDDTRIVAALPSIKYVLEQGGSLVLMSHLGRPKGKGFEEAFTLKPVAEALSAKLGIEVKFAPTAWPRTTWSRRLSRAKWRSSRTPASTRPKTAR